MKLALPLALLAAAALAPAPINDSRRGLKPVPERSQAQVLKEMSYNGAYATVGRVPRKTEETVVPREESSRKEDGAVAAASSEIARRDDGAIVRASEKVAEPKGSGGPPVWLLLALAVGGALGVLRGLRIWADKAVPVPHR